jgi:outer membrane protein OmpA-like peptidoglycan-associated protein
MVRRISTWCALLPLLATTICAQGLDTKASKDDWEEINFEYNSSVLVDGFPSLLRIAELLQKEPGYKVIVEGHTDKLGSNNYNEKLGLARATAVRDFLVKYGARATRSKSAPAGNWTPNIWAEKMCTAAPMKPAG